MEKRFYKDTDLNISLLGYGAMRFPLTEENKIDYEKAEALIDYAYDHGVNYFDTAYMYHDGESEKFLKHALKKYPRESFYLADKMPSWMAKNSADVERIFNDQLERCGVEYFDFYLCHALGHDSFEASKNLGIIEFLDQKKKEGKIRHLGFSFHDSPEVLRTIADFYPWDFAQLQLNYLDWEMQDAKTQYKILEERGIPCIVMEPVRGGTLATLCDESNEILRQAAPDKSTASWAIRFAASLPNVMTVLSGMTTMEQVQDNIKTMSSFVPLTDADKKTLDQALAAYQKSKTIPCTGCRYCMDCPAGVDIPLMFKLYNDFVITEKRHVYNEAYKNAGEAHQAHHCISCGKCSKVCPQSLDIPAHLNHIAELMKE